MKSAWDLEFCEEHQVWWQPTASINCCPACNYLDYIDSEAELKLHDIGNDIDELHEWFAAPGRRKKSEMLSRLELLLQEIVS